jgi:hypothetical protein
MSLLVGIIPIIREDTSTNSIGFFALPFRLSSDPSLAGRAFLAAQAVADTSVAYYFSLPSFILL